MAKPIRTCVLGVGLAGLTFHIPFVLALQDLFTLHSVLERNPTQDGGSVKKRFGVSVQIHRTLEAVIADPEIELIIVGTPNDTHYDFAKAALLSGKHSKPEINTSSHLPLFSRHHPRHHQTQSDPTRSTHPSHFPTPFLEPVRG